MASYLRPRRGKKSTAESQALVLKRGEVFFECPDTGVGTGAGKIKVGDGSTAYSTLPYFLGDVPEVEDCTIGFTDSSSATDKSNNPTYLTNIAPANSLKTIFTNLKQLLYNYNSQLTQLNNDLSMKLVHTLDRRYLHGYDSSMTSVLSEFAKHPSGTVTDYTHISIDTCYVYIGGKYYEIPSQTISVSGSIGQNFYVYANTNGTISANTTRSANSASVTLIGGFHYGRIRRSTSTSDVTIGIIPNSVWTLYFRPVCAEEAMVYLGNNLWGDIYLTRSESNASSTTGGSLYPYTAYNTVPATGTEGYCQYTFVENLGKIGKRLCSYSEFVHAADGSPRGNDNDNNNAWTKTSNTARNNTGLITYAVSSLNICDLVGNVWKWCRDYFESGTGSYNWRSIGYDNKGKAYMMNDTSLHALFAGGDWNNGARCGSRAVLLCAYPWYVHTSMGAWAVAPSL